MATNILLVDEDRDRRHSVQALLTSRDYRVVETTDWEHSVSLLAAEKFDLILLDMTLPDQTGFRVLQFLETNHIATKVMIITGTVGRANVVRSATPGAQEQITKPYRPDDLVKSIEHLLSERSQANPKLQIIKAGDFIKSTPTGDLDLESSREGLAAIAEIGADLQNYTVLIDLRDVNSSLSTGQIYQLASDLATYGKTFRRKTAVLARADKDFNQAAFFETAAQNRGFRVRAFTVFEDALVWLSSATQSEADQ